MNNWLKPVWPSCKSIGAVCTTRMGGVSDPPFNEFNLATHVGDQLDAVNANRRKLLEHLQLPSPPVWLEQVHSNIVVELDSRNANSGISSGGIIADGGFTRDEGVVLAILVADCLPILLASPGSREIAALHVGWKGLASGIVKNGVEQFSGGDLVAWIGPGIGLCHYEIDVALKEVFPSEFVHAGSDNDHWMLDLQGIARQQLRDLGVVNIYQSNVCTYCDAGRFYSFRRDGASGRFAALIWMDKQG